MAIIRPYQTIVMTCADCEQGCEVIIWNGIKNWDIKLDTDLWDEPNRINVIIKVPPNGVNEALLFASSHGPHFAHRVVLWAKDEATYDALIKTDPQKLQDEAAAAEEEADDEQEEADKGTTRH